MDTDMSTKNDTIRLAGHCDAGCKMAIDSMDQISRYVTDDNLRNVISSSKNRHKDLEQEASGLLNKYGRNEQDPQKMASAFSWLSTEMKMMFNAGMLITPEKLEFGKGYSLKEVSAPYGYVLSHEAVKFDVTEENSTEESGVTVVAVKLGNYAQKGIIKISKTGEVFASVTAADGVYQPVYAVQGLAGATYEIKAAADIYTPDGTLRCSAGEVVDTVTTGADGMAESKPLYLGKYEITEIKAPDGMVVNKDVHTAELVYAGQEIEITETAASFCNDRQKVRISLSKVLEQNKQFGIGMNNELSAVTFGFYAAEELTAADGSVIPADGLIEILSLDENGKAVLKSDVPFGSYYVKEGTLSIS